MKMANTKLFLLVLCLAVCVGMCRPWGNDVVEDAKAKAEEAKHGATAAAHGATAAAHDAKEKTESFADWAYDKFARGFGFKEDNIKPVAQNMKFKTEDAASGATETVKSAASGASEYASQTASDAKEKAKGAMEYGKDKAANAYDEAKKQTNKASNMAGDKAYDAKDKMGAMGDKAADVFDEAKHKVGEAYLSAKKTMTKEAKAKYEAAKEKASQATGDLGSKMRKESPEP